MKHPLSFFLFLISFFIVLLSCKRTTEPLSAVDRLQLNVMDVSCTEAWLSLKAENNLLGKTLKLYADANLILSHELTSADTLLYADSLRPATAYVFKAQVYDGNALLAASPKTAATTLDTTSHDFTWQTWEFGGQGGSSSFYDVAIIDENDIWAVGEIYTADEKYNAAHWDGDKWELKKLDWDGVVSRLTCVFAFSKNDVWFGVTNLIHWNGSTFEKNWNPVLDQFYDKTVNKIWGTSDSNLYVVGNNGLIAHYDGRQWAKIENQENEVGLQAASGDALSNIFWSCGYTYNGKTALIRVENNKAALVYKDDAYYLTDMRLDRLSGALTSVSYYNKILYILTSHGLYRLFKGQLNRLKRIGWPEGRDFPSFPRTIKAKNQNDILISGDFGMVVHYNGYSWHYYREILDRITYYNTDYYNNFFVIAGTNPNTWGGVILMGKHND